LKEQQFSSSQRFNVNRLKCIQIEICGGMLFVWGVIVKEIYSTE
jgi:hypothetical protein